MTINISNALVLPPGSSSQASPTSGSNTSPDIGGKERSPFASFLTGASENLERNSNRGVPQHLPLIKEEVSLLVLKLQRQINNHLLRILTEDEASLSYSGSLAAVMPGGEKQPSEIRHSSPKDNALSPAGDVEQIIAQAADAYGVDRDLIRSVIKAESNFEIRSTSPRGAQGLMQLMPGTARELGVHDPYDPRENIMGGVRYLRMLLDRYHGDRDLALAAYNWGMGNVEKHPSRLPQETRDYISRVTGCYRAAKA